MNILSSPIVAIAVVAPLLSLSSTHRFIHSIRPPRGLEMQPAYHGPAMDAVVPVLAFVRIATLVILWAWAWRPGRCRVAISLSYLNIHASTSASV